jgi:protein-disulfide isomerase
MKRRSIFRRLGALIVVVGLFVGAGIPPALSGSHVFTPEQSDAIRAIVREYLTRNPEVILEAIEALKARDQASAEIRAKRVLAARQAELLDDPGSPVTGNPKGDVAVVEFFDYRCPYCKRVHPTIQALLREDKNIRFVYKEWPILGPPSVYAARAALAARSQNRYVEFHGALMEVRGNLDEAAVHRAAAAAGLDVERLKRDMEAQTADLDKIFVRNDDLARSLEITGTPAFVIGDVIVRGATDMESMKKVVADVRRRAPR